MSGFHSNFKDWIRFRVNMRIICNNNDEQIFAIFLNSSNFKFQVSSFNLPSPANEIIVNSWVKFQNSMPEMRKPIPYSQQHITEADILAVTEALRSDCLTQGPKVEEFEAKFAEYIGSRYAVAVSNGTAAMHLSALALGVEDDINVIVSP